MELIEGSLDGTKELLESGTWLADSGSWARVRAPNMPFEQDWNSKCVVLGSTFERGVAPKSEIF